MPNIINFSLLFKFKSFLVWESMNLFRILKPF